MNDHLLCSSSVFYIFFPLTTHKSACLFQLFYRLCILQEQTPFLVHLHATHSCVCWMKICTYFQKSIEWVFLPQQVKPYPYSAKESFFSRLLADRKRLGEQKQKQTIKPNLLKELLPYRPRSYPSIKIKVKNHCLNHEECCCKLRMWQRRCDASNKTAKSRIKEKPE